MRAKLRRKSDQDDFPGQPDAAGCHHECDHHRAETLRPEVMAGHARTSVMRTGASGAASRGSAHESAALRLVRRHQSRDVGRTRQYKNGVPALRNNACRAPGRATIETRFTARSQPCHGVSSKDIADRRPTTAGTQCSHQKPLAPAETRRGMPWSADQKCANLPTNRQATQGNRTNDAEYTKAETTRGRAAAHPRLWKQHFAANPLRSISTAAQ